MFNVGLFLLLFKKINNIFLVTLVSIAASKLFYYTVKYLLLGTGIMEGDLISTPLYMQVIVTVALSIYAYFIRLRFVLYTTNKSRIYNSREGI